MLRASSSGSVVDVTLPLLLSDKLEQAVTVDFKTYPARKCFG